MTNIQDLEPKGFMRTRKVNGEKTIEFTVIPNENNKEYFDLVVEEAPVNALDDNYIIKRLNENSRGKKYIKQATGIHDFYVNMISKQQPHIHNGSITFYDYMSMVFEGTGYTFVSVDTFNARPFENLGNDNRLALLQRGLDRFQAEFELVGNEVRFYEQIGNATDFQFRYGHNVKSISREIDTTNLATVIRGTGDPELGIEAYYRSPNADIFGELDAPPVNDERFASEETLLEEMKARLIDTPQVTITVDFVDLRAAGYPYTVPNEGDRVWLIYEPMDDLLIETRILEIVEYFDVNMNPIRTEVTLSNHKKSFAGTMFDNVQKQLSEIVNDDGVVKDSVIPEAVKIATEALQRAQTELIFDNGIIAQDANDPNRMVVYNSEGIGITDDGGQTFREAITADGFVLSAGVIGHLSANNIQVGPGTHFEDGFDPREKVSGDEVPEHMNKGSLNDPESDNWDELIDPGSYAVSYPSDGERPTGFPEGAWYNGVLQITRGGTNYVVQRYDMYSSLRSSYRRFGYENTEDGEIEWNDWQQEETTRGSYNTAVDVRNVWAYEDTTYIDGGNIYADTVNANVLRGGTTISHDIIFTGTLEGVDGTFSGMTTNAQFDETWPSRMLYGVQINEGRIAGVNTNNLSSYTIDGSEIMLNRYEDWGTYWPTIPPDDIEGWIRDNEDDVRFFASLTADSLYLSSDTGGTANMHMDAFGHLALNANQRIYIRPSEDTRMTSDVLVDGSLRLTNAKEGSGTANGLIIGAESAGSAQSSHIISDYNGALTLYGHRGDSYPFLVRSHAFGSNYRNDVWVDTADGRFHANNGLQVNEILRQNRNTVPSFTGSANLRLATGDPAGTSRIGMLSSKRELKRDIEALDITKEELFSLNPVRFKSRSEVEEKGFDESPYYIGFIAEEVAESKIPELADFDSDGNPVNVNYDRVAPASLPVIKEHDEKIDDIITRLEKLEGSEQ